MTEYIVEKNHDRILLITDIHNCHIDWQDTRCEDRMNFLCECLKGEYEKHPYDCILALGDYSLDHWKWQEGGSFLWNPPVCRTKEFMEKYASQFPAKAYFIAGNHEQYGDKTWQELTGNPREFCIVYGEYVFAMLDTFAGDLDPSENSDGTYTGINPEFMQEIIKKHPDKKIVMCAHDIIFAGEPETSHKIISENSNIICGFAGHTHCSDISIADEKYRHIPVIYCGNFSYYVESKNITPWGYRILDTKDNSFSTDYIDVKKY